MSKLNPEQVPIIVIPLRCTSAVADVCLSPVHHLLDGNHVLHDFAFGLLQHLVVPTPHGKTGTSQPHALVPKLGFLTPNCENKSNTGMPRV